MNDGHGNNGNDELCVAMFLCTVLTSIKHIELFGYDYKISFFVLDFLFTLIKENISTVNLNIKRTTIS